MRHLHLVAAITGVFLLAACNGDENLAPVAGSFPLDGTPGAASGSASGSVTAADAAAASEIAGLEEAEVLADAAQPLLEAEDRAQRLEDEAEDAEAELARQQEEDAALEERYQSLLRLRKKLVADLKAASETRPGPTKVAATDLAVQRAAVAAQLAEEEAEAEERRRRQQELREQEDAATKAREAAAEARREAEIERERLLELALKEKAEREAREAERARAAIRSNCEAGVETDADTCKSVGVEPRIEIEIEIEPAPADLADDRLVIEPEPVTTATDSTSTDTETTEDPDFVPAVIIVDEDEAGDSVADSGAVTTRPATASGEDRPATIDGDFDSGEPGSEHEHFGYAHLLKQHLPFVSCRVDFFKETHFILVIGKSHGEMRLTCTKGIGGEEFTTVAGVVGLELGIGLKKHLETSLDGMRIYGLGIGPRNFLGGSVQLKAAIANGDFETDGSGRMVSVGLAGSAFQYAGFVLAHAEVEGYGAALTLELALWAPSCDSENAPEGCNRMDDPHDEHHPELGDRRSWTPKGDPNR